MANTMDRGLYGMEPFNVMDGDAVERIHINSLNLLETMGIKIFSEEALRLLKEAGADVDMGNKVAVIPSSLVMESVRKCKRPVRLCARDPKKDMVLDGKHCHICTDGTGVATWDIESGQRRDSTKKDVGESA
jgi:trimethylamine--corrinoid protein Co-methyltransferase